MRSQISYAALGLALVAGATAARAQTVITRQISDQPVETVITQQPVETTVQTTRIVRTTRPIARRVITTRRTIVSQRVLPPQTIAAPAVAATYPQPLYDVVAPAAVVTTPTYPQPLYDEVLPPQPPPVVGATPVAAPVYTAPVSNPIPTYRYIYEPDRILVIDPTTNIAIQAIPR